MPWFAFDEISGVATCILYDGTKTYCGSAMCHPDDRDMISEKTGQEIAYRRAEIEALKGYREEIKIELKTLKQLYFSMNRSKYYDNKHYEARMLLRHIKMKETDLDTVKTYINNKQTSLKDYINEKDEFYKKIRHNREVEDSIK